MWEFISGISILFHWSLCLYIYIYGFPGGTIGKELACQCKRHKSQGFNPWVGKIRRSPGGGNGNHSSILAWRIPWTEESVGLQSVGSQRVRHDWSNLAHMHTYIYTCLLCQVLVATFRIFSCGMWTLSCGIWDLVPWAEIEPRSSALEERSLSQ